MHRRWTAAAGAALAVILGACGPDAIEIPAPPAPGLGVSLKTVEAFFDSQGGGGWIPGSITGGHVGYAAGSAQGQVCPSLISGVSDVSRIIVGCPQALAATVMVATIHRFAPGASTWATQQLSAALQSPSGTAKTTTGPTSVQISHTPTMVTLTIQPKALDQTRVTHSRG
jgi:hypothetical protein